MRTPRPGITVSNPVATGAPLACALTLPAAAGAGGAAVWTTFTRRLRRTIAVVSVVLTFESRLPFVSGAMPTAPVAASYWLVRTLNTAVGASAIAGPPAPVPLERAWTEPPLWAARRCDARTAVRASRMNLTRLALALPAAATGGGMWAMRYLAPPYERI